MYAESLNHSGPRQSSIGRSHVPGVLVVDNARDLAVHSQTDVRPVVQLAKRGILQAGVSTSPPQGRMTGRENSAGLWMVCFNHPAMVSVRGKWRAYEAGSACLLRSPVAISIEPGETLEWGYAFVCYSHLPCTIPLDRLDSGIGRPWNADPLVQAIRGLHCEAAMSQSVTLIHHWIELIHGYVIGFASAGRSDDRISRAWRAITSDLKRDWSVDSMAATAMMSAEHFRRLCLKELGCSPMKHLTNLRVEKAAELLLSTDCKMEAICDEVGYEYRSTFSNVFTKVYGMRPSAYREHMLLAAADSP